MARKTVDIYQHDLLSLGSFYMERIHLEPDGLVARLTVSYICLRIDIGY